METQLQQKTDRKLCDLSESIIPNDLEGHFSSLKAV